MIACHIVTVVFCALAMVACQFVQGGDSFEDNLTDDELVTYQAIKTIHMHLDDDHSGTVDHSESVEFLLDELESKDQTRHTNFHGNDSLITVEDLWASWKQSEVHNWTDKDVISWLISAVKLPEYVEMFTKNDVNGTILPRLAADSNGYILKQLGIMNAKHRKKIALRAADVVLFGPNSHEYNYVKDISLLVLLLLATATAWYAVHEKKQSRHHIEQMMKDVDCLQQAEQDLIDLQEKLALAEKEQMLTQKTKLEMEALLKEEINSAKSEAERLHRERETQQEDQQDVQLLERELQQTKRALAKVEDEAEMFSLKSPQVLQQWLQMTYKKEGKHFQLKRLASLKQMEEAKAACEKINKKRNGLLGSLRLAQGQSIDEVDHKILSARSALAEVTNDLQERQHRWQQIEILCGFPIANDNLLNSASRKAADSESQRRRSSIAQALASCGNVVGIGSIPAASDGLATNSSIISSQPVALQRVVSAPSDTSCDESASAHSDLNLQALARGRRELRLLPATKPNGLQAISSQSDDVLVKSRAESDVNKLPRIQRNRNTWSAGTPSPSESLPGELNMKHAEDSSESNSSESHATLDDPNSSKKKTKKYAKFLRRTSDQSKNGKNSSEASKSSNSLKRGSLLTKFKVK